MGTPAGGFWSHCGKLLQLSCRGDTTGIKCPSKIGQKHATGSYTQRHQTIVGGCSSMYGSCKIHHRTPNAPDRQHIHGLMLAEDKDLLNSTERMVAQIGWRTVPRACLCLHRQARMKYSCPWQPFMHSPAGGKLKGCQHTRTAHGGPRRFASSRMDMGQVQSDLIEGASDCRIESTAMLQTMRRNDARLRCSGSLGASNVVADVPLRCGQRQYDCQSEHDHVVSERAILFVSSCDAP